MTEPTATGTDRLPLSVQLKAPDSTLPQPPTEDRLDQIFGVKSLEDRIEKKVDEIELIGEELAADFQPQPSAISPAMRYLHCSRTIHQLVTDRNRAVGLYLAVASLLWTASAAILNVKADVQLMVPLPMLQFWCMPVTLATSTILAIFTAFLLVRTRIGLIYEVAKMNVLLGLPIGRVKRINPLSIFFIMQALVSLLGAGSGAFLAMQLANYSGLSHAAVLGWGIGTGILLFVGLIGLYIGTVLYTTSDQKLDGATK